ncbi:MAG: CidB/LrgB family autolysis modulator [Firmicutes bacterium]|nr:CidB/LrgB family autolysis modulator [Bacillota bacterium]
MLALACLILTVIIYFSAKWYYQNNPKAYLSPLLTAPLLIIAFLTLTHISYQAYYSGAKWLSNTLQPATIAFAFPLYKYRSTLKQHAGEIIVGVLFGSIIAIISSDWIAKSFSLNPQLVSSLIPHSITTPIAMDIAKNIGGIPAIAAVFVIITGLAGALIGPLIIKLLKIETEVARGILFGTSAHGAGTAKAFEFSSVTGTISSLAMIITAIISACIIPTLIIWLGL